MIGGNILQNPDQFLAALHAGDDITVHTYTHPYMTTLSNDEVLREVSFSKFFLVPPIPSQEKNKIKQSF